MDCVETDAVLLVFERGGMLVVVWRDEEQRKRLLPILLRQGILPIPIEEKKAG